MTKEPLNKSISVSELLYMRNVEHLSNREIGQKLDVHPATIMRYIGPDVRQPDSPKEKSKGRVVTTKMVAEIRKLYMQGQSINGVAEHVGVSWSTVKKYVSDLGPNRKSPRRTKPEVKEAEPVAEESKPITEEAKPVVEESKPIIEEAKPVVEEQRPKQETPKDKPIEQIIQVQTEDNDGGNDMFEILSKHMTLRIKGAECEYEIETGAANNSVTIINGTTEVIIFDADSLPRFISELQQINDTYMKEAVADG